LTEGCRSCKIGKKGKMKNLQRKVLDFTKKYNLAHSNEITTLDLVSEIGEVAKEILKSTNYGQTPPQKREELKKEIGDALYSLINLANLNEIDLEEAVTLVMEKYEKRLQKGSAGSENE